MEQIDSDVRFRTVSVSSDVWSRLIVSYPSDCHLESTISECIRHPREIGTMGTISDVHVEVATVSRRRMYVCVG